MGNGKKDLFCRHTRFLFDVTEILLVTKEYRKIPNTTRCITLSVDTFLLKARH